MEEFNLSYKLDRNKKGDIELDFNEKNISLENRYAAVQLTSSLLNQTFKSMLDKKILNEESEKKFSDALDVLIWMSNNIEGFLKERDNALNDLGNDFDDKNNNKK